MTPQLGRSLDDALMVASLAAFGRPAVADMTTAATPGRRSFGTDWSTPPSDAADGRQRCFGILGAEREDLDVHLRRAIVLLGGDGHSLDVASLVRDLGRWGYDGKPVQKRWAYHFWAESGSEFDDATKGKTCTSSSTRSRASLRPTSTATTQARRKSACSVVFAARESAASRGSARSECSSATS